MREDYQKVTSIESYTHLKDSLIPKKRGVPKTTFDMEHTEAIIKDAFKNGSIQEPIYGKYGFLAHESLARPVDANGKKYSISNISNLFYEEGLAVQFDTLTSSLGMKNSENRPITLNISIESALSPEFFDGIKSRMERHNLENEDIIFEILEHDVKPNVDISHLESLKEEGFRFALDDFSIAEKDKTVSKENVNRIAVFGNLVDFVKIDGPLVRAKFEEEFKSKNRHGKDKKYFADDFKTSLSLVQTTMPQADIICERVYNKQEADILFDLGVKGVQGWDLKDEDFNYTPDAQKQDITLGLG
jgi:EAL domain-containing protein (putative c-di-GMP-specific phosphodiesterase class I)